MLFVIERNYQRTPGNGVVAVVGPIVVDIGQAAVPAVAAVKPVGVLKICFKPSNITGNPKKLNSLKSAPADGFLLGSPSTSRGTRSSPKQGVSLLSVFETEDKREDKP